MATIRDVQATLSLAAEELGDAERAVDRFEPGDDTAMFREDDDQDAFYACVGFLASAGVEIDKAMRQLLGADYGPR